MDTGEVDNMIRSTGNKFRKGETVVYTGDKTDYITYPDKDTLGKISRSVGNHVYRVTWETGTNNQITLCEDCDMESADIDCVYCSPYPELIYYDDNVKIRINGRRFEISCGDNVGKIGINFCPACGRKIRYR